MFQYVQISILFLKSPNITSTSGKRKMQNNNNNNNTSVV